MNPDFLKQWNKSDELICWIKKARNQDIFARAWLDGYTVEKEKKFVVKLIKTKQYLYCRDGDYTFVTYLRPDDNPLLCHTRKELEEAGFGWVFECEGVEVEEVENE